METYGDAVQHAWDRVRSTLEPVLREAGLDDHLDTVRRGLEEQTRSGAQSAMYGCRSLLVSVADHLWRDPRSEYLLLPGASGRGLDVSSGRYINRLGAFINERVPSRRVSALLRADLERIWESLDRLNDLASKAHNPGVALIDADFTTASTYLLLGELVRRTGFVPVTEYGDNPVDTGQV